MKTHFSGAFSPGRLIETPGKPMPIGSRNAAIPALSFFEMDPELAALELCRLARKRRPPRLLLPKIPRSETRSPATESHRELREQRRTMGDHFDPAWVAFINTMGCPFQPFFFFNNHGNPRECQPLELPFTEPIGTRGSIVTLRNLTSARRSPGTRGSSRLAAFDRLELKECFYGAVDLPCSPFRVRAQVEIGARSPGLTSSSH